MNAITNQHILISRTDAIGDVVLTLPMCGYLKSIYPGVKISFLGRTYTKAIIDACGAVDGFINYDSLKNLPDAKQVDALRQQKVDIIIHVYPRKYVANLARFASIPLRVGTTNRFFHWFSCNKLVKLSRKNSPLHEAQLNIVLLQALGIHQIPEVAQLPAYFQFSPKAKLSPQLSQLLDIGRFNIILHPKSHGSGREWGLNRFAELITLLPPDKFNILITGSDKEKTLLTGWIASLPSYVTDLTGAMSLDELVKFIGMADGLVASGTGPLHIAAESGIHTLGLFPILPSIHARRWGPIGEQAEYLEVEGGDLEKISAADVYDNIKKWLI